jgi:hypothetical protein
LVPAAGEALPPPPPPHPARRRRENRERIMPAFRGFIRFSFFRHGKDKKRINTDLRSKHTKADALCDRGKGKGKREKAKGESPIPEYLNA